MNTNNLFLLRFSNVPFAVKWSLGVVIGISVVAFLPRVQNKFWDFLFHDLLTRQKPPRCPWFGASKKTQTTMTLKKWERITEEASHVLLLFFDNHENLIFDVVEGGKGQGKSGSTRKVIYTRNESSYLQLLFFCWCHKFFCHNAKDVLMICSFIFFFFPSLVKKIEIEVVITSKLKGKFSVSILTNINHNFRHVEDNVFLRKFFLIKIHGYNFVKMIVTLS